MHELGLCASIVDAVEQRAAGRAVARVRVQVGRLLHVHPEAFDQSFAMAAMGTVAHDARAELVMLPVRSRCTTCEDTWESDALTEVCPGCGAVEVELIGGAELILELVEYRG